MVDFSELDTPPNFKFKTIFVLDTLLSFDDYFSEIGCHQKRKSSKTNGSETVASSLSFEDEQQPLAANADDGLGPVFHPTVQEIAANTAKVIDEKLGTLSQTLQARALELRTFEQRAAEAENRISAVERTSEQAESWILAREKTETKDG